MELHSDGRAVRVYDVGLGFNPEGHKWREGDGRTPEGVYEIDGRNPNSAFHLSLHISYPNDADRATAAAAGVSPGGMIMIHGLPNQVGWLDPFLGPLQHWLDWSAGCVTVSNAAMEEIWRVVPDGTPIAIRP